MKRNTLMLLLLGGLALLAWWWFGNKETSAAAPAADTKSTGTQIPVDLASYLAGGDNTVADLVNALTAGMQPAAGTTTQTTPATAAPATTATQAAKAPRPTVMQKPTKPVADPNAIRRV